MTTAMALKCDRDAFTLAVTLDSFSATASRIRFIEAQLQGLRKEVVMVDQHPILFTAHDRSQADRLAHHTLVLDHRRPVASFHEIVFTGALGQDSSGNLHCAIHDKI